MALDHFYRRPYFQPIGYDQFYKRPYFQPIGYDHFYKRTYFSANWPMFHRDKSPYCWYLLDLLLLRPHQMWPHQYQLDPLLLRPHQMRPLLCLMSPHDDLYSDLGSCCTTMFVLFSATKQPSAQLCMISVICVSEPWYRHNMGVGQSCLGEMATSYSNTPCLLVIPFAMTPWDKETHQLPATIERQQVMFHINLFY